MFFNKGKGWTNPAPLPSHHLGSNCVQIYFRHAFTILKPTDIFREIWLFKNTWQVICESLIARIAEGIRLSCMRCITNLQLNYVTVICTNVYTMMRLDVSDKFKIEPYACEMTSYVGSRYRINQKEISPKNVHNVPMAHDRTMN